MTSTGTLLATLILGPLAGAAFTFVFPQFRRWIALVSAAAASLAAIGLALEVKLEGTARHSIGGWGAPLGIDLRADGLSAFLLLVTAGVAAAVGVYARAYFAGPNRDASERGHRERYFWPLWLFLWASLNALFLSADLFNIYVTLELLGLSAVALVALAGKGAALTAAMRYLLVSLAGSLFYLLGVAVTYGATSTVDLTFLPSRLTPNLASWTALSLMTLGLIMKAALFPMHFWLPAAHANAPAPVSALLSALVVKGSFYVVLRIWFEAYRGVVTPAAAQCLGALGAAAIFWGSIQALLQVRLKLLVAYSTVAQLGYLFLAIPLALSLPAGTEAWGGALIFLGAHACAKTAMFLSAGNILQAAGHDRIQDLDGVTHRLPVSVFAFGLAGISLVGLPPSTGFMGKWLLLSAGLAQSQWVFLLVILGGSLLAAAYVMRFLTHAFTAGPDAPLGKPIAPALEWTSFGLALLAVLLGFVLRWPMELLEVGAPMAASTLSGGGGR